MLVAREKEKRVLLDALKAEEAQFIAVYGRRRVGKTYLTRREQEIPHLYRWWDELRSFAWRYGLGRNDN